jgi:transposase
MGVVFTHCAGLDGHQKTVMACRVVPDPLGQQADGIMEVQALGTLPRDLLALSDWLTEAGITHVAMESTGEYWKPVYTLLEGNCTVFLVNAAHVKNVPGRQTDRADARWLAKLMRYGVLQASFIPPAEQRDLRDLTRYRTKVVQERRREINRVQGVLERANIQLASVASDIMGVSGRAILAALLEGRAAPATMAELARGRLRRKIPVLEQALTGLMRDHHRRLLALQVAPIDVLEEPLDTLSADITRLLTDLSVVPPAVPPAPAAGGANEGGSPATPVPLHPSMTFARAATILDAIPGVDQQGGALLVAEWGIDMARFGTAARLAAWSGVAPGHDASAGTQRAGKTRKGNRALRTGLTPLAHAAALTQGTYVSALYHRLAARRGKKRAIMAVAHSIVVSAFQRLSRNEPYRELGATYFDDHQRAHLVDRLTRRLEHLGSRVRLEPVPTT